MIRTLLLSFLMIPFLTQAQMVSIADARQIDADGVMIMLDEPATIQGITVGYNFRPGGITWTVYDTTDKIGLSVFNSGDELGYAFKQGDHIEITGVLAQFNGLSQIAAESITLVNEGNPVPEPASVAGLNEDSESALITLENVSLVDASQWQNSGSFNVDVTNGITISQVRVDSDTDISGRGAPTGVFSISGMGGQFDSESPYFEGYQLFPRTSLDIDPYIEEGEMYMPLTIAEARSVNTEGVSNYDGQAIQLNGFALGINLRPGGLQFALVDDNNVGIGVFSLNDDFGYTVVEGENLIIEGSISQFNGLTQINVETITPTEGAPVTTLPKVVSELSEDTESSLTKLENLSYVDQNQWLGDGSSFNVELTDGSNTFVMRIDNDTEMSSEPAPLDISAVIGIGGQFDSDAPFLDGYQILPRYWSDIDISSSAEDILSTYEVEIYPNPVSAFVRIDSPFSISNISIYSTDGKLVSQSNQSTIDASELNSGNYILKFEVDGKMTTSRFYKN